MSSPQTPLIVSSEDSGNEGKLNKIEETVNEVFKRKGIRLEVTGKDRCGDKTRNGSERKDFQ